MATQRNDPGTGSNERIDRLEKKALLSALWMFVLLNFIFRDLHEIVKAEFLADALNGIYNGREITEAMFLLGGIIVEVPIVMMLMSWVLPLRANRWANIVVAPLFGLCPHRDARRPRRLLPHRPDADGTRHHRLAGMELGTIPFVGSGVG